TFALVSSCKAQTGTAAPSASAQASAAPIAAPAPTTKPWFSGGFSGNYEAKLAPVEVTVGAVREWKSDDGKLSSGPGKLTLQVDDEGMVDGSSEGALGQDHASGKVEDDTLRVLLAPTDPSGLRGVLVATRDGDGFKGSIQASSSDSLRVRSATVELKKQAN
ncbi:MAG TPA: hypothetical protein VGF76_09820, partial [Polyangiaceae bacterium]